MNNSGTIIVDDENEALSHRLKLGETPISPRQPGGSDNDIAVNQSDPGFSDEDKDKQVSANDIDLKVEALGQE